MLNFKVHFFFLGFVSTLLHPMFVTSMQSSSINSIGWGWHMPMELDLHVDALMSCSLACTITDIISGFEWQDFRLSNDETLMVLGAWTFLGAGGEHSTARFSFFIPSINFVFEHDVKVFAPCIYPLTSAAIRSSLPFSQAGPWISWSGMSWSWSEIWCF